MLATVLKNKGKIEEAIVKLKRYKRDALQKIWEKVSKCVSDLPFCIFFL
jgi:structural maintenance of chromosome 2